MSFDVDKLEGISDTLRKFIIVVKTAEKKLIIPSGIANELVNNEQLREYLKGIEKIYIDMRENPETLLLTEDCGCCFKNENEKFDLMSFINATKGMDFLLALKIDNVSDINEEMLEILDQRAGIKIEMQKTTNDRITEDYRLLESIDGKNRLYYGVDTYIGSDILELKEKFKELSSNIPDNISIDEKVQLLYDNLKNTVKIEELKEDQDMLSKYKDYSGFVGGLYNHNNEKSIEEFTKDKVGVKLEYKSVLDTLKSGKGNAIDFLDTFFMLLRYNNIDCRYMSNSDLYIDSSVGKIARNYTDEFVTPPKSVIQLKIRTISYSGNDGKRKKIKKFVDELVVLDEKEFEDSINDNKKNDEKIEEDKKEEIKKKGKITLKGIKEAVANFFRNNKNVEKE